ncbi:alpha/beta hydrolase, partial [Streptomyces sp. NPDC005752]|uniref:alpha/beta hydrolase n=1 Tax=Streptomyces sp. NPDC005752 TaxID=3157065 RepID=UPI0033E0E122
HDWADAKSDMGGVREAGKNYLDSLPEPPKDGSPKDNAAWWNGLSPEEQSAYLSTKPASVGALDGLPAEDRDEANRTVLAAAKAQVQLELDRIPPEPTKYSPNPNGSYPAVIQNDSWSKWNEKYGAQKERADSSLKGMQAIEDRFDSTGENGLPPAYLLGFDTEKNGRAIVANGNPDTADHTAVYVPGTTSNLGGIGGDVERMTNLWRESDAMAGGKEVSTVTWLGYDAPQSVVKDAPFRHYADDGAPAFNQFMEGLNTANTTESGGHHTAVGHSYGTTLIGSAARQGDLNADDVVFAGSPGVQVGEASQMDVPEGHVWNEEAEDDPVPDLGRFGHGGNQWRLGGGVAIIPSDELFGANQMATGTSEGHSEYWDPGTDSLKNQAAVVTGQYGKVTLEE